MDFVGNKVKCCKIEMMMPRLRKMIVEEMRAMENDWLKNDKENNTSWLPAGDAWQAASGLGETPERDGADADGCGENDPPCWGN